MKHAYDGAGGERGTGSHAKAERALPVSLAPEVAVFVQHVAAHKGVAVVTLVNDWLRHDMACFETVMP